MIQKKAKARTVGAGLFILFSLMFCVEGLSADSILQEDENHILIFQGISSNEYLVKEALDGMDDYGIREYWVQQPGPALVPKNRFSMNRLPGRITLDNSRVIILADVPVSPDNVVPAYFLRRLEDWVKAGGVLITLGGPFSYAKGGYKNTLLEDVLPFYVAESPWDCIEKADKPRIMVLGKDFGVLAERTRREHPAVYYSHNVELKEGAKTLINCDQDIPLWVYRDYGEGRVISFTGTPMGVSGGGSVLFTEWEGWGDLLREIVNWSLTK